MVLCFHWMCPSAVCLHAVIKTQATESAECSSFGTSKNGNGPLLQLTHMMKQLSSARLSCLRLVTKLSMSAWEQGKVSGIQRCLFPKCSKKFHPMSATFAQHLMWTQARMWMKIWPHWWPPLTLHMFHSTCQFQKIHAWSQHTPQPWWLDISNSHMPKTFHLSSFIHSHQCQVNERSMQPSPSWSSGDWVCFDPPCGSSCLDLPALIGNGFLFSFYCSCLKPKALLLSFPLA